MSEIAERLRSCAALVETTKAWPTSPVERKMHDIMVELAKQLTEGAAEIERLEAESDELIVEQILVRQHKRNIT